MRPRDPAPGTAGWTRPSHRQWPRLPCGEGGAEESSSASIAGQEGGRQKRADSRQQQDRRIPERQAPCTALQPAAAGGQPWATGPTLTWRLQPQPQAEIKATGISLVGLPRGKAPGAPAAPTPWDSQHFQALPWAGPSKRLKPEVQSYGRAHCSSGTWGEPCPFHPLELGPRAGNARPALEGVSHEPGRYSLGDSRACPQVNSRAGSPNTTPSPSGLRSPISYFPPRKWT